MLSYLRTTIPQYSALAPTTDVAFEEMYRTAILYYICGHAQLIDDEATQDARATVFKNKFVSYMLSIQA